MRGRPCHHWLSVNTNSTDFPKQTFSEVAIFFWKAAAVNVIVDIVHIKDCAESRGAYARDELKIRANAPSPLLSQTSVKMGGGIFSEA